MPARLNVVIVQSPHMSALQSDVTEQVMIELLGRPGLDLLIVQSLVSGADTTDHMALAALENDCVIVDWHSEEEICKGLAAIGIEGYCAPHELNPKPQAPKSMAPRRLYCFDLRLGFNASQVAATILKLLAAKQVQTVRIGNLASIHPNRLPVTKVGAHPMIAKSSVEAVQNSSVSPTSAPPPYRETTKADLDEDQQLDRLVDGLNHADW